MNKDLIIGHLADYKKKTLKILEDGVWKKNKKPYAHILPEILNEKNIIDSGYYQEIIDEIVKNKIKLHSDFHHLNSSQALCFNLFFPIFFGKKFIFLFNKKIKVIGEEVEEYEFEYVEDKNENTNFDLYVRTNKAKIYFEIKYTENEFGKAKSDEKHIKKYNEIYKKRIEDTKFKVVPSQEIFFSNYQLFRNLINNDGNNDRYNIFVFPKDRSDLRDTINSVIENHCTEEQKDHIIQLSIEKIVETMLESDNKKLKNHYEKFSEKYFVKK